MRPVQKFDNLKDPMLGGELKPKGLFLSSIRNFLNLHAGPWVDINVSLDTLDPDETVCLITTHFCDSPQAFLR